MEKGTQTLLGNHVSIYEEKKTRNAVHIQMKKKQNERESLPDVIIITNIEKEKERKRADYHNKRNTV